MRIVIDIDGTICETKKPGQTYDQLRVTPGAVEKIKALKDAGHYIILQTARHMKTMNGDVAKVIEKVGKITEDWLKKNNIPYDEIHFGKPYNHIILDDRCMWFEGWDNVNAHYFDDDVINVVIDLTKETFDENLKASFLEIEKNLKVKYICIVKPGSLQSEIQNILGSETSFIICTENKNPLETALLASDSINNLQRLLVVSNPKSFSASLWENIHESNLFGAPLVFKGPSAVFVSNDEWGYVQAVNNTGNIGMASLGVNYFRGGRDFVSCAKAVLASGHKEVIFCYNELVKRGQQVRAIQINE